MPSATEKNLPRPYRRREMRRRRRLAKRGPANLEAEMKSLTATAAAPAKPSAGNDGVTTPERKEAVSASLDAALKDASLRAERARHSVEALEALAPPDFPSRRDRREEK